MSKIRNAFADLRDTAALLASSRWPKSVTFTKSLTKASSVARGATKFAIAVIGQKLLNVVSGKSGKQLTSVSKAISAASLGATLIEEMDPKKLRRPLFGKEQGSIINPLQIGKSIAETNLAPVITSMVTGMPVAVGIPPKLRIFKTLLALKNSPRYYEPGVGAPTTPSPDDTTHIPVGGPDQVLIAQHGLLEDEIAYRLTLLAENVLAPLKQRVALQNYNPMMILEGFRAENTKTSPHERGEAVDITLGDGSLSNAEALYQLAIWARDHIIYDQLILCYGELAGGQVWLHITFTPDNRRRQVLTKPFNDVHMEGLHLCGTYTDAEQQAADQQASDEAGLMAARASELLLARQSRLQPIGVNTPETLAVGLGETGGDDGTGGGGGTDGSGEPYVANNALQTIVTNTITTMLTESAWKLEAVAALTTGTDTFLRELLRRCYENGVPSSGDGALGLNAIRGVESPISTSPTAIAIFNRTGAKGFGSWGPSFRVQIMRVVANAGETFPVAVWDDITAGSEWTSGGGFVPLSGSPVLPVGNGPVPSDDEVLQAVQNAIAADPGFAEYLFPYGGFNTYSQTEVQRVFAISLAAARDLATRYPGVGVVQYTGPSGTTYPGFSDKYAPDGLMASPTGPEYDVLARQVVGAKVHMVASAQRQRIDGGESRRWRSPVNGEGQ